FDWICSLFSSGSTKPTEEEKKAMEEKKQLADVEAMLKEALADPKLPPEARKFMQDCLDILKLKPEIDEQKKAVNVRYKDPVATDDKAMLYLFDMTKLAEPMMTLKEFGITMGQQDPQKTMEMVSRFQNAIRSIKEYLAQHKTLKVPNKEERDAVIEMI